MDYRKKINTKEEFESILEQVLDLKRDLCYFMVDESPNIKHNRGGLAYILEQFIGDIDLANELLDYKLKTTVNNELPDYKVTVENWLEISLMEDFEEACDEFQDALYFRGRDLKIWARKHRPEFFKNETR